MTVRINARLDDELAAELEALRRKTGQTLTAIIEEALDAWVANTRTKTAISTFEECGFVGVAKGPADLARNSKKYLKDSLRKKT
ncbi:MAG: CopG family transcriptional regulator [Myxococcaceae bacterium]|nr:CopG family transcriptional regulator [Myxococcaceae bacterium]